MRRPAMIYAVVVVLSGCVLAQPALSQPAKPKEDANNELEKAWEEGWLPHRRYEYPPSHATLERARKRYAANHPKDAPVAASATAPL